MVDWTHVILALIATLPPTIAAVGAVILGWRNSNKIDANTILTKDGTQAAASNAKKAADTAESAKTAADKLAVQLNGELDKRIAKIVTEHTKPLMEAFEEHNKQDENNMLEIRNAIVDLKRSLTK